MLRQFYIEIQLNSAQLTNSYNDQVIIYVPMMIYSRNNFFLLDAPVDLLSESVTFYSLWLLIIISWSNTTWSVALTETPNILQ